MLASMGISGVNEEPNGKHDFYHGRRFRHRARLKEYQSGSTASLAKEIMKGLELTAAPDADVLDVAKAIVKIVDMPSIHARSEYISTPPRTEPRSSMVLPTVSVRNCYGTCSSRIYSGHRQLKSRLRKLRKARTEVRFWRIPTNRD